MDIREQLERGKETVALRISRGCNVVSGFAHITLEVVYVKSDKGKYNDSIGFYENYSDEKHQYKGLQVTCQMSSGSSGDQPYAWELSVGNLLASANVSLKDAESIVKTLRPIHRKLDKISQAEGYVESLGEFVLRLVRVLNVKAFYALYPSNRQFQRNDNIGKLRDKLRAVISENQQDLGVAA